MEKPSKEEREERKAMKYNSVWCKWMPTVVKAAHERRDALNANTIADSCCRPRPNGFLRLCFCNGGAAAWWRKIF